MSDEGPHSDLDSTPGMDPYARGKAEGYIEGFDNAMRQATIGDDRTIKWLTHQLVGVLDTHEFTQLSTVKWTRPGRIASYIAAELLKAVQAIPDDDPRPDTKRGMYGKYYVERLHDTEHRHDGCRYFVLDPLHDLHARVALKRYAAACAGTHPVLSQDIREWLIELPMVKEQSNIRDHATRELMIAGWLTEDTDEWSRMVVLQLQELLEIFIDAGHSGMSAGVTLGMFEKLANFKPLSPLTNDPAQWNQVSMNFDEEPPYWQSTRDSEAFSTNCGKTYYLLSERRQKLSRAVRKSINWLPRGARGSIFLWYSAHFMYPMHKSLDALAS